MTNRATARRYARVLLDVSTQQADPDRIEQELSGFLALLQEHTDLGAALVNPVLPLAKKRALVQELVALDGGFSEVTSRLLTLLAERDRLGMLLDILAVYRELMMTQRGVVRARVTTTEALPDERVQRIQQSLAQATCKEVTMETDVNPALLGGIVTQIGSIVYDGSVARHLERLRQRFLTGGLIQGR